MSVLWVRPVGEDFHARFSALARSYRYVMLNRWVRPAIDAGRVSWQRRPLDEGARHRAVREIQAIGVSRAGDRVLLDVTANGFLYHMVRNIAGTLLAVGQGDQPECWVAELLAGRAARRGPRRAGAAPRGR